MSAVVRGYFATLASFCAIVAPVIAFPSLALVYLVIIFGFLLLLFAGELLGKI